MADFNNPNAEPLILNGITDVKITLPDPITLLTGKLFTTRWSRFLFKKTDAIDDALEVLFGNCV